MFTLLTSIDCLEQRKKRPYKPGLSAFIFDRTRTSRPATVGRYRWYTTALVRPPVGWETTDMTSLDSFRCCKTLKVGSKTYAYYSLAAAEKNGLKGISRLPFSMKVLLENLLRHEDGRSVTKEDLQAVALWLKTKTSEREMAFRPARVLMQDFTGVPAVVDLAAMRDAMQKLGGDPKKINPLIPVELVIDHSVQVDEYASRLALSRNAELECERNRER